MMMFSAIFSSENFSADMKGENITNGSCVGLYEHTFILGVSVCLFLFRLPFFPPAFLSSIVSLSSLLYFFL
jgi:hypothetical protein